MSSATVPTVHPVLVAPSAADDLSARPGRARRLALGVAIPALLCAPLLIPSAADARTIRTANVYAYGEGDVNCYVVAYGGTGIECLSQAVPSGGGSNGAEGDGYVALRRTGPIRIGARSDFPGYSAKRRKLHVGDTWRPVHGARGVVCTLRRAGLTCTNRSRHGFTITPTVFHRF
jgi:hypothetical protein